MVAFRFGLGIDTVCVGVELMKLAKITKVRTSGRRRRMATFIYFVYLVMD